MEENNHEDELLLEFEKEKKSLKIKHVITTIILLIIVAVFSSEFTMYYYAKSIILNKTESSADPDENINAIAKNLKNFRKLIDQVYIGEIDEEKMLDVREEYFDIFFRQPYQNKGTQKK